MKVNITIKSSIFIMLFSIIFINSSKAEQIFCPDDITISCCQDYNNLAVTGDPADKNQHFNYFTKVDSLDIDDCRIGLIKRTWTGHNVLGQYSCVQFITMERIDQFSGNINWPNDWAGQCGEEIPYSEPQYDIGFCDQIGHTFKDDTFRFVEDACVKILRNWKLIDWCVYNPNSGSDDGLWKYTQVFMIVDTKSPEITECKDRTIDALNSNCSATFSLSKNASDNNCGQDSPLKWVFELDLNNDWQIDTTGTIDSKVAVLDLFNIPVGNHTIKWKVFDGCANVSTCMEKITVVDGKPPTLICYLSTTFNIMQNTGADSLSYPAKNFVKDAYDNCTAKENIVFSYSSELKDSVKVFKCWDLGFQFLRIYAIDENGNYDFTYVLARVGINGPCSFNSIAGSIVDMSNSPMNGIDIGLEGNGMLHIIDKTDNSGKFSFPYKESEIQPKLKFFLNKKTTPKIDINDIKIIHDFLLGKTNLTNIQKFAADLNNDQKVSVSDILILKKLLLGKIDYNTLENSTKFFIKDTTTPSNYREIDYIEDINAKIEVICVTKGNISIK